MKPPSVRTLARDLKEANRAYDGPGQVVLAFDFWDGVHAEWRLTGDPEYFEGRHVESIPGDGQRFDAMAVARRLLAGIP